MMKILLGLTGLLFYISQGLAQRIDVVAEELDDTQYVILKDTCPDDIEINIGAHEYFKQIESQRRLIYFFNSSNSFENISFARNDRAINLTEKQLCQNTFQPESFLHYFTHKTITFCGDSLTRQLFHALNGKLHAYSSKFRSFTDPPLPSSPKNNQFPVYETYYPDYNFTLVYCGDSDARKLLSLHHHQHHKSCVHNMLDHSQYILLGFAAWWKPYFTISSREVPDYHENAQLSEVKFAEEMNQIRQNIEHYFHHNNSHKNPPAIFWKLSPHAGDMEARRVYHILPKYVSHDCGWSVNFTQCEAEWVSAYNTILRSVARQYGDHIIGHDTISHLFLQAMLTLQVTPWVHWDALHYVINGLPSAMTLVIFDAFMLSASQ